MTIEEASDYLATPVPTLYNRVWRRKIPFVRLGRSIRFDVADLDAFIDENKVSPRKNWR